jgi:B-cell receptor-associated protein 31
VNLMDVDFTKHLVNLIFGFGWMISDAVREMRKYSNEEYDLTVNPKAEMQAHMKLFRAQRNFYISGFALLFSL